MVSLCGILYSVLSVSTLWDTDDDVWRSFVDSALVKRTEALWVNPISGESACLRSHAKGGEGKRLLYIRLYKHCV